MIITVIGHGYVGLVSACVFADLGNSVYVIGRNKDKITQLSKGNPLIFEPGLRELLKKNLEAKRIIFSTSYAQAIPASEVVFIAVGTPPKPTGEADLTSVYEVAQKIAPHLKKGFTVVSCKSTVPIGTNRKLFEIIKKHKSAQAECDVASCPEFLREGSALSDAFYPDRVVIGAGRKKTVETLTQLHKGIGGKRVIVSLESAEIIKYASNSILATKISFANLIAFLCEKSGADVEEVLDGVGLDERIGRIFLNPGVGYGGSCFPKDIRAIIKTGEELSVDMSLLKSVEEINQHAKTIFFNKLLTHASEKRIGLWGLSFKPNTDDIRDAPSLFIIEQLLKRGFIIQVYDPESQENIKKYFKDKLIYCKDPYEAAREVCLIGIITEWNEFKQIDLMRVKTLMKKPVVVDGRNLYNPKNMLQLGFTYISTGRKNR